MEKSIKIYEEKNNRNAPPVLNIFSHVLEKKTDYHVAQLKVVLNTTNVAGYNQIDAIGISSQKVKYKPTINTIKDEQFAGKAENLGYNLNSAYDDMLPIVSPDEAIYFFLQEKVLLKI